MTLDGERIARISQNAATLSLVIDTPSFEPTY
jgi:hypothetical protein